MRLPSCLADPNIPLIADTSVVINLNATGCSTRILQALPNPLIITEVALSELGNGRRSAFDGQESLTNLVGDGLVRVVKLGEIGSSIFLQLVSGSTAETLDDGEAATIAYAIEKSAIPLIDERKAIRICSQKFETMNPACTVDVLSHQHVQTALEQNELSDAVFNALTQARMRVLPQHINWVIGLIGHERAQLCNSLSKAVRSSVVVQS